MVQWLGLRDLTAKDLDSIPDQGTKIPKATRHSRKKKQKKIEIKGEDGEKKWCRSEKTE